MPQEVWGFLSAF